MSESAPLINPYEISIALRYLRSRNKSRFVSFISMISVVGIALATTVLIVVLSVMNGFEYEVRNRILTVVSHASISGIDNYIDDYRYLQEVAKEDERVISSSAFVEGQGILVSALDIAGVRLHGIEPEAELATSGIGGMMREGRLEDLKSRGSGVVIGSVLAAELGLQLGDKVVMLTTQGTMTPAGLMPRTRRFTVTGIFHAGMYEYDRTLAYTHIEDAGRLFRAGLGVTGVRLAVTDPMQAEKVVRQVAREYGGGVYVTDWTRQQANFFRSIELTKSIVFIILLLVVAVAAFNIVSTLVMVVRDKRAEIGILRSLGASRLSVLCVFVLQGTFIGLLGAVFGVFFGVLLSWNMPAIVGVIEAVLGFRFLEADVYFISDFPSRLLWADVLKVSLIAFGLAVLSTLYPAWKAATTRPAEALRHE